MHHLLRLSACAAAVAVFFLGAWACQPALLRDFGLDVWEWPAWQHSLDAERQRQAELVRRWQAAARREQMKNQICRELIEGRLTLREAARRFRELPDLSHRLWDDLRVDFPDGTTDEERLCRHVLKWACDLTAGDDGALELRRRLDAELRAIRGRPQGSL